MGHGPVQGGVMAAPKETSTASGSPPLWQVEAAKLPLAQAPDETDEQFRDRVKQRLAGGAAAARRRGPNKPKPGKIEVHTEAVMNQAEIVSLLQAHAAAMLGSGPAAKMELQINTGDGWRPPGETPPHGAVIRFATKGEGRP